MKTERKKIWKITMPWALIILILTGCSEDFVEVEPTSSVTKDGIFSSFADTNIFLNQAYATIVRPTANGQNRNSPFGVDPHTNWTDDTMATFGWPPSRNAFARRDYSTSNAPFGNDYWVNQYSSVRQANILIEGVESAAEGVYSQEEKDMLLGQAKFLRALFYLKLVKPFGGVPLIDKVLDRNSGEDIAFARSSFDETIDFIVNDARQAANLLPEAWLSDGSTRATKGAALAVMADAQIFAERYADCVSTCEEAMGLGYSLASNFTSIFRPETEDNSEVIFDLEYNDSRAHDAEVFLSPRTDPITGVAAGWGHLTPTQQLVDAFEFTDGAPGNDPGHANDPYTERDNRFYSTILYDNSDWRGGKIITRFNPDLQPGSNESSFDDNHTHQGTLTGYYGSKYLDPNVVPSETSFDGQSLGTSNHIIYRYAEILLYFAEAKNELSGPDGTVLNAINELRARGDVPALAGLSQTEMRDRIRNERRVELAFEDEKRYWDIIRWRIGGEVFNRSKKGMRILEQPDGSFTYTRVDAFGGMMNFNEARDYLMPIPQQAIEVNSKLDQNPGW